MPVARTYPAITHLAPVLALIPTLVFGQAGHAQDAEAAMKARQGQFRIMAYNIGILGAMAKGESEYLAETATTAADNLVAISQVAQNHWPEGSDNGSIDGTRALPAIWNDPTGFLSAWEAYKDAAASLQAAAGDGRSALGPAVGAVGNSCGACHEDYRESSD
jgi:cytochrome c556